MSTDPSNQGEGGTLGVLQENCSQQKGQVVTEDCGKLKAGFKVLEKIWGKNAERGWQKRIAGST